MSTSDTQGNKLKERPTTEVSGDYYMAWSRYSGPLSKLSWSALSFDETFLS